jgi:hypothetical protein
MNGLKVKGPNLSALVNSLNCLPGSQLAFLAVTASAFFRVPAKKSHADIVTATIRPHINKWNEARKRFFIQKFLPKKDCECLRNNRANRPEDGTFRAAKPNPNADGQAALASARKIESGFRCFSVCG